MSDLELKRQQITRQIVQKIVDDPAFREEVIADSEGAIKRAGLADELTEMYPEAEAAEVSGYAQSFSTLCCITVVY